MQIYNGDKYIISTKQMGDGLTGFEHAKNLLEIAWGMCIEYGKAISAPRESIRAEVEGFQQAVSGLSYDPEEFKE